MAAQIVPDKGGNAAGNLLDGLFGTANSAVDVWQKWQAGKVETLKAKADIPTTAANTNVTQPSGFSLSPQNLLIIGGVLVGLVIAGFVALRK
jgi:hypothetical protein